MNKVQIIAEVGINHNGDLKLAKRMITEAAWAGADYVKFQKRNPDVCVPEEQKGLIKETPWGTMTYLEYKHRLEFNKEQYKELYQHAAINQVGIFASVWDKDSVDFMSQFESQFTEFPIIMKIPSALITDIELGKYARTKSHFLMASTGMSTEQEIYDFYCAVDPHVLFHTNSCYPSPINDINLLYVKHLQDRYTMSEIGYSGHESGYTPTIAAVAMGVTWVERHFTVDKEMWGSDQTASLGTEEFDRMVRDITTVRRALGTPMFERRLFASELSKRKTLRGV